LSAPALVDSNVLVAAVAAEHEHHAPSLRFASLMQRVRFAVAAHSFAEAYNTLTREGSAGPFRFPPNEALAVLEDLRHHIDLLGPTPSQTFDGVRQYAQSGGIGPRLYDKLIGDVAVLHGIDSIVTWNLKHMRGLFVALNVQSPDDFMASRQ
jgi:predicted nucleic acid-binding protein